MRKRLTLVVWIALLLVLVLLVFNRGSEPPARVVEFEQLVSQAEEGEVADVRVDGRGIVHFRDLNGRRFVSAGSLDSALRKKLAAQGARVSFGDPESEGS